MDDRRTTPANGRVAALWLKGSVTADRYVEGNPMTIGAPVVDLLDSPRGRRDRQLLLGTRVKVYENLGGWSYVQSARDGYVGYVMTSTLRPEATATHRVKSLAAHSYSRPDIKSGEMLHLPYGCAIRVTDHEGNFAVTDHGFVPLARLEPVATKAKDPVAVAEHHLGVPYLWGGNSTLGIDCSGLVQASMMACGIQCAGDSDMQLASFGQTVTDGDYQRGDLLFWKGHVAMVVDAGRIIHANANDMAVAYEGLQDAINRIAAQDGGPVTGHKRA